MKGRGKKIMIVDDETDVLFVLTAMLNKEGYTVIEAISGEECLDKLKETRPDLIILDIMMPDMDGWEVCKKIKEDKSTSSIPVLMLSAVGNPRVREKSLKYARADVHLTKSIDTESILNFVNAFLKNPPK